MFHAGAFNLSASVKAYCALKAIGDAPEAPHMVRARQAILGHGGAERANVFTRIQLALYGAIPWRGVPVMPVEIMHLPKWFFFNVWAMSYWVRTCVVPLLVLQALRPRARNPRGVSFEEIFWTQPERVRDWIRGPYRSRWGVAFKHIDTVLRWTEPLFSKLARGSAVAKAVAFVEKRLNGGGRARGDLPGHGLCADDVRRAGLSRGRPAPPHDLDGHRQAARRDGRGGLLPALRLAGLGHEPVRARHDRGGAIRRRRGAAGARRRLRLAGGAPGHRRARGLGRGSARCRARRLGVPVPQRPLPGRGRHGGGRHAAPPQRAARTRQGRRAGPALDRRDAEPRRRLGRLRCRQRPRVPQPHPVLGPRRAARSADRRRDRPLHLLPVPARARGGPSGDRAGAGLPPGRTGAGRQLVRALGDTDTDRVIAALEALQYDVAKGPERYRACDHQAIQSVLITESKKKSEMQGEADLFKILEVEPGAEAMLRSCDELGHRA